MALYYLFAKVWRFHGHIKPLNCRKHEELRGEYASGLTHQIHKLVFLKKIKTFNAKQDSMNFYFNIKSKPHICKYTEGDMPTKLKHFKYLHLLESEILFWTSEHVQLFCSFSTSSKFQVLDSQITTRIYG